MNGVAIGREPNYLQTAWGLNLFKKKYTNTDLNFNFEDGESRHPLYYLSFCEHDLVKRELLKIFYFLWFHPRNLLQQFQMRFVHDRMPDLVCTTI